MPEQDGYQLLTAVRARGGSAAVIPAVAVTAYARDVDRQRALGAGFDAHVPKPVEPAELVVVLAAVARRGVTDGPA
jgi:CheY-like chemotaxis protein